MNYSGESSRASQWNCAVALTSLRWSFGAVRPCLHLDSKLSSFRRRRINNIVISINWIVIDFFLKKHPKSRNFYTSQTITVVESSNRADWPPFKTFPLSNDGDEGLFFCHFWNVENIIFVWVDPCVCPLWCRATTGGCPYHNIISNNLLLKFG